MSRTEKHEVSKQTSGSRTRSGRITPLGRMLNIIGTSIIVAVIVICMMLMLPKLFGIQTFVVISGSMEPAIPVGSMVCAKAVDPATLEPGDILVFYSTEASSDGGAPITHRVIENYPDTREIITKGDANESIDRSPAAYINVVGKVVLHIPALGRLVIPLSSITGKAAIILILLGGYLLTEAGSRMRR